jgi:hypothetical protein
MPFPNSLGKLRVKMHAIDLEMQRKRILLTMRIVSIVETKKFRNPTSPSILVE